MGNSLINNIKINNNNFIGDAIKTPLGHVTVNWNFESSNKNIRQHSFEIKVSTHKTLWGTDNFQENVVKKEMSLGSEEFWRIPARVLERGTIYYGQIRAQDTERFTTIWVKFSFVVNRSPFLTNIFISPSEPSEGDVVVVNFGKNDDTTNVLIRWFRNGIYFEQFDNFEEISSRFITFGDIWRAELTPFDGVEKGGTVSTDSVTITKLPPILSSVEILPKRATVDDILEARFTVIDPNTNREVKSNENKIRWFINNGPIEEGNDEKFVRFELKKDDEVRFTITPNDGAFTGETISSDTITVLEADFRILGVRVDGKVNNFSISNPNPVIEWNTLEPFGKTATFVKIQIGNAPFSNNVFEEVVSNFDDSFSVPGGVLKRGTDYYATIFVNDTNDNFKNGDTTKFRISGSLWDEEVENSIGWTIELSLLLSNASSFSVSKNVPNVQREDLVGGPDYQRISISDGNRFAEVRFYNDGIQLLSDFGKVVTRILSEEEKFNNHNSIIIIGSKDDIKVFVNNKLVIDGSGFLLQSSDDKFLEVGAGPGSNAIGEYKFVRYNIEGSFEPGISSKFSNFAFEPIISFEDSSIDSLFVAEGNVIAAVNPFDEEKSGVLYKIIEDAESSIVETSSVEKFDFSLNDAISSSNDKFIYFPHTTGTTIFKSYFIPKFDLDSVFSSGFEPKIFNWELVKTVSSPAVSFTNNGLIIDTTFANTAIKDDTKTIENVDAVALRITWEGPSTNNVFSVAVEGAGNSKTLVIYNNDIVGNSSTVFLKIELFNRTISEVANKLRSKDIPTWSDFALIEVLNNAETDSATGLFPFNATSLSIKDGVNLKGDISIFDPYTPIPYPFVSGGKWFYTQRKPGTPWFDNVDNSVGWTVDFDLTIDNIEDNDFPSETEATDGIGLYINDGTFYETINFLTQDIIFANENKKIEFDTTSFTKYRITGKDNNIKLFARKESEADFLLLSEIPFRTPASNSGNSGRPHIFATETGVIHAVWHDDGNSVNQIYYSKFTPGIGWTIPELIVKEEFSSSNPQVSSDSNGHIYVVFETSKNDYTDIAIVVRGDSGWSDSFVLSSNILNSLSPAIAIDSEDNVHIVWEDHRNISPEIFYVIKEGSTGQWNAKRFGGEDLKITSSENGASNPSIVSNGNYIYIAWVNSRNNGDSGISLSVLNRLNNTWQSSGQGGSDFSVSSIISSKSGYPDVFVDLSGQVFVVWHDVIGGKYQIFGRIISPNASQSQSILQLTTGDQDSRFPKGSLDTDNGNLYVVFEKEKIDFIDPYSAYFDNVSNLFENISQVYMIKFNSNLNVWESSNQSIIRNNKLVGGFDALIFFNQFSSSRRPIISKRFFGGLESHIMYEFDSVSDSSNTLLNRKKSILIRDSTFDLRFKPTITLSEYSDNTDIINRFLFTKEIRFGDFSPTIGVKMAIKSIKYYLKDSVDPFKIRLVSSATTNIPRLENTSAIVSDEGDAWIGTEENMFFYNFDDNVATIFKKDPSDTGQFIKFGIEDKKIIDIKTDSAGNFYLITTDKFFISLDHIYFFEVLLNNGSVPLGLTSIAIDSKQNVFIGSSDNGILRIPIKDSINNISVDSSNFDSEIRTISVDGFFIINNVNDNSTISSNNIISIKIDDNDVVWIGTRDDGLNRYLKGQITRFNTDDGLTSNFINDIAIRSNAIRYIATSSGVTKMVGSHLEKLDFNNINAPVSSLGGNEPPGEVVIPAFFNVSAIIWKDPNVLFLTATDNIYQITFLDENFFSEQTQITQFTSEDFALLTQEKSANDGLQLFELVGSSSVIDDNTFFEVFLNGKPITIGFTTVAGGRQLFFKHPLRLSDNIKVNIRNDINILNNFTQNIAEETLSGKLVSKISKIVSDKNNIFASIGRDINAIYVDDAKDNIPFDKIILDTIPPQGKIVVDEQIDQTIVKLKINQLREIPGNESSDLIPFDSASGIDKMVVSSFDNFTVDGKVLQDPIPFVSEVTHDLGLAFTNLTKQFEFTGENEVGSAIGKFNRVIIDGSGVEQNFVIMYAGSGNPANIYRLDTVTDKWELIATLDEEHPQSKVNFITEFDGKLVVGTGVDDGIAKIYVSTDGNSFSLAGDLPGNHSLSSVVFDGLLYIGVGGNEGKVFRYNGTSFVEIFSKLSSSVFDLTVANNKIFAATGDNGRVYLLDVKNLTQTIVHSDEENKILSIQSTTVNDGPIVFAGTDTQAKILRHNLATAFVVSFNTIPDPVRSMIEFESEVFASIGSNLYNFNGNTWNIQINHDSELRGITDGIDGAIFVVSDNDILKFKKGEGVRNIYLKLIDRAGNETQLFVPIGDGSGNSVLDNNLFASISIEELVAFTNKNKIIEVDNLGNTIFSLQGTDEFFSANRIDEEKGIYFSEIFNGSNGHIFWDRITFDINIPGNTFITASVRSATTKDNLLDANFSVIEDLSKDNTIDLQFLSGQFLQFKIEMSSRVRGLSPLLRRVILKSVAADATHFFTTNFVLPSRIKSGILTSQKMLPVASDIIFGIDTNNNLDFTDYQIIDENKIFTTSDRQLGSDLRVGIRFITPSRSEISVDRFSPYGPYETSLDLNAVEWTVFNDSTSTRNYHFRVTFFSDSALTQQVFQDDTKDFVGSTSPSGGGVDPVGWAGGGEAFLFKGFTLKGGQTGSFSFTPIADNPLLCNTFYFVKIESLFLEDPDFPFGGSPDPWKLLSDGTSFVESCGTTFTDRIDFEFSNNNAANNFHFRIRFFSDAERTNLAGTVFSGNDQLGWFIDDNEIPSNGIVIQKGETASVTFAQELSSQSFIETGVTYSLSIDAFDGIDFVLNSNSFTFRSRESSESIYCGPYSDVPVLKNFAIMFEMENNEFITLNLD